MKKLLLLTCLLFLTFIVVPTVYAQDVQNDFDFSNNQSDTGEDLSSTQTTATLDEIINDLDSTHQDILDEIDGNPNMALNNIANKINRSLDLLDAALEASDEGDLDVCDSNLTRAQRVLSKTVRQFEAKLCSDEVRSRRCIPQDDEAFLEDLQDESDNLDDAISTDEDEDGISDVCGLSEE